MQHGTIWFLASSLARRNLSWTYAVYRILYHEPTGCFAYNANIPNWTNKPEEKFGSFVYS